MRKKNKTRVIIPILAILLTLTVFNGNKVIFNVVDDGSKLEKQNGRSHLKSAFGDWEAPITKPVGSLPWSVFIGDANNDGYNDIVTANPGSDGVSIISWNETSKDWNPQIVKSILNTGVFSVFVGDANNDGYNDIVAQEADETLIFMYLWNPIVDDWDSVIHRHVGETNMDVFIGDANNDGFNDIVVANRYDNDVSILIWNNASGDWQRIDRAVGANPQSVFVGDANNDGYNDIVTSNIMSTNTVSILIWNNASGDWQRTDRAVGDNPQSVFVGDANNDGYNDILSANAYDDSVSILVWNNTSGDWQRTDRQVGDGPWSVFIGDANNDGYNDMVTSNYNSDDVSILLWSTLLDDWATKISRSAGDGPRGISIGDLNNDGYNDMVTCNYDSNEVSIFLWRPITPIIIHTPEKKTYKSPMKGYYPATYGFENDAISEAQPERFNNQYSPNCSGEVISEIDGHERAFRAYDNSFGGAAMVMQRFNEGGFQNQPHGTIEYWFRITSISVNTEIRLNWDYGINDASMVLRINETGEWQYNDGIWNKIPNVSNPIPNTWYHIKIHFRCQSAPTYLGLSENQFEVIINGECSGPLPFVTPTTEIAMFVPIYTAWGDYGGNYAYCDAIGYSWDPNYNIGDNLNEGLLLSFTSKYIYHFLDYSLDDQELVSIIGNTTISMPDDGLHSIQVFGIDAMGFFDYSEAIPFIVKTIYNMSIEITNHFYSDKEFNITFFISNETGHGINITSIQMWWNGADVSSSVINLGNGFYFVSLEPITVIPGEDPILLKMIISADGYQEKNFETYIAVDPDTLEKDGEKPGDGFPLTIIIIAITSIVGAIGVAGVSLFLLRRRKRASEGK